MALTRVAVPVERFADLVRAEGIVEVRLARLETLAASWLRDVEALKAVSPDGAIAGQIETFTQCAAQLQAELDASGG